MAGNKQDFEGHYFLFAYEVFAGILGTPASVGVRGDVLKVVIAQQYGWAKLESATLCPTEIGQRFGHQRSHVSRAIKELCEWRVLILKEDGSYRFNRHHEQYEFPETPSNRAKRIAVNAGYADFVKSFKEAEKRTNNGTLERTRSGTTTNVGVPDMDQKRTNNGTEIVPPKNPLKEEEFKNQTQDAGGVGFSGPNAEDKTEPFVMPEGYRAPAPEFEALCRKAQSIDSLTASNFGPLLRGAWSSVQAWWQENPDPKLWNRALLDLAGMDRGKHTVQYFVGIIKRMIASRWTEADGKSKSRPAEDNYVHPPVFTLSPEALQRRMEAAARTQAKVDADPDYLARKYQRRRFGVVA